MAVDLFASRLNSKLDKYISLRPDPNALAVDAFSYNWTDKLFYINPPFSLMAKVLQKMVLDSTEAVVVAPKSTQAWWASLQHMVSRPCFLLPKSQNILYLPLDKLYSGSQASSHYTASQNGMPVDDRNHIDVVSDSMRRNITSGKYVNLAAVLIPVISKATENMDAFELLKRQQRDRLDRPLSITQFYKAFGIFNRVMCEAYPLLGDELDLYEADIGSIYDHYGEVFYHYHVQFTKKAAAYMEKSYKVSFMWNTFWVHES